MIRLLKKTKLWPIPLVVVILLLIVLKATWPNVDDNTRFGVVAALIGLVATLTSASITHLYTKKREIDARHFAEKREAYIGFLDILIDMSGGGKKIPQPKLVKEMMSFKKGLLVWGRDDFIKVWNKVEKPGENLLETMENLDSILRWIRADLGHDDSSLQTGDLTDFLLVEKDRGRLKK